MGGREGGGLSKPPLDPPLIKFYQFLVNKRVNSGSLVL